jgi:hypothetical protein
MIRTAAAPMALAALAAVALPAGAQVTPEQVWAHWQQTAQAYGTTLTAGSVAREGDTLVISDIRTGNAAMPDAAASPIGWIRLQELGDGTVRMTAVPEQTVTVTGTAPDGTPLDMSYVLASDALVGTISGTPERLDHRITADALRASVPLPADGSDDPAQIDLALTGVDVAYATETNGAATVEGAAASATLAIDATDDEDSTIVAAAALSPVRFSLESAPARAGEFLIPMATRSRLTAEADAGTLDVTMTSADQRTVTTTGRTGPMRVTSTSADGQVDYAWRATDMETAVRNASLPEPFTIRLGESSGTFAMPFGQIGQPGPWRLALAWRDLDLGSTLWQRIDPAGAFAHGPLTLALDLGGTLRWTADIFGDPAAAETLEGAPFAVDSLRIDALELVGGDATLTGSGAFDIAPGALESMQGFTPGAGPLPVSGRLDLAGAGINGLLDSIVAAGLVPAQDMLGVRAMIGMFAVPTGEDDGLTSALEITPEGKIVVNGMPFN